MPRPTIQEVLEERGPAWRQVAGVVGTGIGRCGGEPCLKVFVREVTPEVEAEIPDEVEGYPVKIERTGEFRAREPS